MPMRLKGKQVGAEEAFEKFLPSRQNRKDFRRGERDVQEETDSCIRQLFAKHSGQEHQVVVVNPDQVVRSVTLDRRISKESVRLDVGLPVFGVKL